VGYLAKSLAVGQSIVVSLNPSADREDVIRSLSLYGVRINVLGMERLSKVRIGIAAPSGLTPTKEDHTTDGVRCLALARSVQQSIVITLREGADADAVLEWFASDGLVIKLSQIRGGQSVYHVIAHDGLLVLRDELTT
jgi:hypothetical protein